jgi:hypothetical protein
MVQYTVEEKQLMLAHVAKQGESGLSIRRYCKEHGIAEHVFHYWRTGKNRKALKPTSKFIELNATIPSMPMDVLLPSGALVRFSHYAPVEYIKSLCSI